MDCYTFGSTIGNRCNNTHACWRDLDRTQILFCRFACFARWLCHARPACSARCGSGQVPLDEYAKLLNDRTKIVAVTQVSNAPGTAENKAGVLSFVLDGYSTEEVDRLVAVVRGLASVRSVAT
jgi:hypothetical protein